MSVGTVVVLALKDLVSVLCPDVTAVELLTSVREVKPRILLDMRAVRVLDCSGIGLLAALHRVARSLGGDLKLFGLQDRPWLLLEVCGLLRVLKTFESEADALASIVESDDPELYLERAPVSWVSRATPCEPLPIPAGADREAQLRGGMRI